MQRFVHRVEYFCFVEREQWRSKNYIGNPLRGRSYSRLSIDTESACRSRYLHKHLSRRIRSVLQISESGKMSSRLSHFQTRFTIRHSWMSIEFPRRKAISPCCRWWQEREPTKPARSSRKNNSPSTLSSWLMYAKIAEFGTELSY